MKVLFVTWDSGAVDYLTSLFFPTFAALAKHNVEVHTLQGTWGDDAAVARTRNAAEGLGLHYQAVQVDAQRRKAQMPQTMVRMAREIVRYVRAHDIDIVMPRAMIPGAMVLLARPWLRQQRIVWDADGLPADERVDFAGWSPNGPAYKAMRAAERAMLHVADSVMVRTARAAEILRERAGKQGEKLQIHVIPNGRDPEVYQPNPAHRHALRKAHGIAPDARVLVSVGSLGPQYYPGVQAEIVARILGEDDGAFAVFLTAQHAEIQELLQARGVDMTRVIAKRVPADQVPHWLAAADVGLALRQPSFSQQAVCPLKVGEYLLSGLPVIATTGVGDLDTQLQDIPSYLVHDAEQIDHDALLKWLKETIPASDEAQARCRAQGVRSFSLGAAVEKTFSVIRSTSPLNPLSMNGEGARG